LQTITQFLLQSSPFSMRLMLLNCWLSKSKRPKQMLALKVKREMGTAILSFPYSSDRLKLTNRLIPNFGSWTYYQLFFLMHYFVPCCLCFLNYTLYFSPESILWFCTLHAVLKIYSFFWSISVSYACCSICNK